MNNSCMHWQLPMAALTSLPLSTTCCRCRTQLAMDIPGRLRAEEQSSAVVGSPDISAAAQAAELKEQEEGHSLNTPWTMWLDK